MDRPPTDAHDPRVLAALTRAALQGRCRRAGLPADGSKANLVIRLATALVGDAEALGRDAWRALNTRRLNHVYEFTHDIPRQEMQNVALAAIRELNHLRGLYKTTGPDDAPPESPEDAESRRTAENDHLDRLIRAVETYLEPLGLAEHVDATDTDLIRAAADRIVELEKGAGRRHPDPAPGGNKR